MEFRFNERFNLHSENGSFEMTQSLSLLQFKKVSSYISQSTTAPGSRKIRQNEEIISEMQKNINDQLNQMATEENQPYRSDIIIDTIKYFGILVIDLLIETKLADKLGFSG